MLQDLVFISDRAVFYLDGYSKFPRTRTAKLNPRGAFFFGSTAKRLSKFHTSRSI
jgi:hypothetical protein